MEVFFPGFRDIVTAVVLVTHSHDGRCGMTEHQGCGDSRTHNVPGMRLGLSPWTSARVSNLHNDSLSLEMISHFEDVRKGKEKT